jgi:hypothetical protein
MALHGTYSQLPNEIGGSLGNVSQKLKKNLLLNVVIFRLLVHFQDCNLYSINYLNN